MELTHDVEVAVQTRLVGSVRTASTGAPVPEALITLLDPDGQMVGSTITGVDGQFVFNDLPAGAYTVIASGYPPVATEVRLGAGMANDAVITVQPPSVAEEGVPGRQGARQADR